MVLKTSLPALWEDITNGRYPAPAVTLRLRKASEAKMLPRRRIPLTDRDKASFLLVLYSSNSHVDAVDAAREVADLKNPGLEFGTESLWWDVVNCRFEDALTRIIHGKLLSDLGCNLLEISIVSTRPEAMIALGGWHNGKYHEVAYRYYPGTPRGRFGRPSYDERHVSGTEIRRLSLPGFHDSKFSAAPENHEP